MKMGLDDIRVFLKCYGNIKQEVFEDEMKIDSGLSVEM